MSVMSHNNVLHHCRTCLRYLGPRGEDESQVLKYHLKTTENLADWIENFLPLRVLAMSDDYPQFVCRECFKKLKEFNEFQLLACQAAEKLRALLENLQIEISESTNLLQSNLSKSDNISKLQSENISELEVAKEEEFLSLKVKLEKQPSDNTNLNIFTLQSDCGTNSDVVTKLEPKTRNVYEKINDLRNPKEEEQIPKTIKKYDCDKCGYSFSHHSILNAHKRQIHNQAMPKQLLKSKLLKNTKVNIDKEKNILQCDICYKVFKCKSRFKTHVSSSHEKSRPFACQFCHLRFTTRQNLTCHKRVHTGEKPFTCEVCNRHFSRLGSMKKHRKTHDSNSTKKCASFKIVLKNPQNKTLQNKLQSTNLDEIFKTETQLEIEKEAEIKMEFECTDTNAIVAQTNISGTSKNELNNFNTTADSENLIDADDFQGKSKKSRKKFITASHSNPRNPKDAKDSDALSKCKYKCDQCDQTFPHKLSVTAHKRQVHNQAKSKRLLKLKLLENTNKRLLTASNERFETCKANGKEIHWCNICQREFSFKSRLNAHILLKHKGLRPFACQQCPLSFTTKCQLQTHERIHTGEKPFTCDICERSFTQLANLHQHRKHSHEYQFACNSCDRRFATKCQLQIHEYIHTGEKAFTCDICDRSFTQLSNLYKHQKYTHKYVKATEIYA